MVYSNNSGDTSPTRPQSVGGNYSPASALKPRLKHTSHLQLCSMHKLLCPDGDSPRAEATCFSLLITQLHGHYVGITITYIITSPFLHPIHLRTSHLGFHISTVSSPKIYLSLERELPPSQPRAMDSLTLKMYGYNFKKSRHPK